MDERGAAVGTSAEMWRSLLESAATSHLAGAKTKSKENQSLSHHLRDKCQPLPKLSSIERVTIYPSTLTPDLWSRPASCHHLAGDTMEEVDALLKNLQESISGQPSASWPAALHTPTTPTTAAATHSSFATYDSALSHEPWVHSLQPQRSQQLKKSFPHATPDVDFGVRAAPPSGQTIFAPPSGQHVAQPTNMFSSHGEVPLAAGNSLTSMPMHAANMKNAPRKQRRASPYRGHTSKEPQREMFATDEAFDREHSSWRAARDQNNESVRRSRAAKRELKRQQKRMEEETKSHGLASPPAVSTAAASGSSRSPSISAIAFAGGAGAASHHEGRAETEHHTQHSREHIHETVSQASPGAGAAEPRRGPTRTMTASEVCAVLTETSALAFARELLDEQLRPMRTAVHSASAKGEPVVVLSPEALFTLGTIETLCREVFMEARQIRTAITPGTSLPASQGVNEGGVRRV
eukprot:m.57461 g.57461  ORF g.57461 m.57461 type:complete len:465 (-) comp12108_c0_seq6:24-1418(-)